MIAGIWTNPMVIFGSVALIISIIFACWAINHPELDTDEDDMK